jgi:hypothetical protein
MRSERTVNWSLTRKLLENLGGTSKSVTRLANRDVEDELLDAKLLHWVLLGFGLFDNISILFIAPVFLLRILTILNVVGWLVPRLSKGWNCHCCTKIGCIEKVAEGLVLSETLNILRHQLVGWPGEARALSLVGAKLEI